MDFDDVVQLAADLVGIPSVSGGEGALADLIEAELSRFDHLQVLRDGDAVVARTDLGRPSRILLAGHIDTVPVAGNVPGELREDGTLWGRGSVDMKAGDAVFLHLAARLSHPRTDLTWVFYDHEEVEASLNGLGRLASRHPDWLEADLAVLGEPTDGGIEGGCNGTMRFSLTARGVAAHSARPWMGENAIHALLPALETLAAWQPQTRAVDGLDYTESLLAVAIGGGRAGNSVPDEARLVVNFRFAPDRSPDEAEAYVRSLFPGYEFDVQDMAPGARPGMDHAEFARLARLLAEEGAGEPTAKLGWTDVARFADLSIPAINCGPGDPLLAHRDDEACPTDQIARLARVFERWLR
ncbi:MAG: succinyl-diaminopimelate desuccinylase [Peptidiphaga sp.]|jgi:succinyl-diaminopimelate desuccinylase